MTTAAAASPSRPEEMVLEVVGLGSSRTGGHRWCYVGVKLSTNRMISDLVTWPSYTASADSSRQETIDILTYLRGLATGNPNPKLDGAASPARLFPRMDMGCKSADPLDAEPSPVPPTAAPMTGGAGPPSSAAHTRSTVNSSSGHPGRSAEIAKTRDGVGHGRSRQKRCSCCYWSG